MLRSVATGRIAARLLMVEGISEGCTLRTGWPSTVCEYAQDGRCRSLVGPATPWSLELASRWLTSGFATTSAALQSPDPRSSWHATTVLCVRKAEQVVVMADGQVTRGSEVVKPNVRKVRRLCEGKVIGGFAGATADAFFLFEKLEVQLDTHSGQLTRAAVELAKAWRTDKYLRRLDATMIVADAKQSLTITGNGDILEPHDGIIAIGSGGAYALAAARALMQATDLSAREIAERAMHIAADACIYTNHEFMIEELASQQ